MFALCQAKLSPRCCFISLAADAFHFRHYDAIDIFDAACRYAAALLMLMLLPRQQFYATLRFDYFRRCLMPPMPMPPCRHAYILPPFLSPAYADAPRDAATRAVTFDAAMPLIRCRCHD